MDIEEFEALWNGRSSLTIMIDGQTDLNIGADPVEIIDDYGDSVNVNFTDDIEREVAFLAPIEIEGASAIARQVSSSTAKNFIGSVRVKEGVYERTELRLVKAKTIPIAVQNMLIGECNNPDDVDFEEINEGTIEDDGRIISVFNIKQITERDAAVLRRYRV